MEIAIKVADYILRSQDHEEPDITKLKLQKLLYYTQGFFLAEFDKPLFDDEIEAWDHGPVVPNVWNHFSSIKGNLLEVPEQDIDLHLNEEEKQSLDEVIELHSQYSAWALREMSHNEEPCIIAYNNGKGTVIPQDEIKIFFKTKIVDC